MHVRAENVSLRAEVHRAREQVKRSAQSVLVELHATSTSSETMQARAEHEQQLKLQQSQLQHERHLCHIQLQHHRNLDDVRQQAQRLEHARQQQVKAATAEATAQLCMHSDRTAAAQAHSSQLTAQLQARVAALEQECVVLRVKLTDAVERRHDVRLAQRSDSVTGSAAASQAQAE